MSDFTFLTPEQCSGKNKLDILKRRGTEAAITDFSILNKGLFSDKHIKNDSPTLLISIYHGFNDLIRIPKLINSINKNYNFYLRYYGGNIFPTEIVFICKKKVKN